MTLRGLGGGMGSPAADVSGNPICPCRKGYMSQNRKCLEQCLGIAYKLELYIAGRASDHMQFTHGVLAGGRTWLPLLKPALGTEALPMWVLGDL